MLDPSWLIEIISGRNRSPIAVLMRGVLYLLTPLYAMVIRFRNWRFDRGHGVQKVGAPIISVGNLTTGGTGKTPMILRIVKVLRESGRNVAVVSRGYRSHGAEKNDEAVELESRIPGLVHLQNPDRVRAAEQAFAAHQADVVLLDDGFQHRRLARDFDIVLIDATNPFGFDSLLPRGLLREPVGSLERADLVVITRTDQVNAEVKSRIRARILAANPVVGIMESITVPTGWLNQRGEFLPLSHLQGSGVVAFCGIGNPGSFQSQLAALGLEVLESLVFEDHHHYSESDLARIGNVAERRGAKAVVCTHKDLVKIESTPGMVPFFALQIETRILDETGFANCLKSVCP